MKISGLKAESISYDIKLLFPVLILVGIGIVMVYSASSAMAFKKFGTDSYFLKKQGTFALAGIVALVILRHTPYRLFRSLSYIILISSFVMLSLVKVPDIGYSAGGADRWIRLLGLSFQPSEFARFSMIIYLAYSMSKKQEKIKEFSIGFMPHVFVLSIYTLLILIQPDFGSVIILCLLTWIMMFSGGVRITHLLSGLLVALPLAVYLMQNATYRMKRVLSFMDPWSHSADEGYQVVHSLMAFGSGGIFGSGIGQGYQKLFYLPEPHTDFIFSVVGEELGFFGVLFIIGLYTVILWRGIIISKNSEDLFGSFVALGITTAMGLQIGINMGVAMGLLPPKGLALPFLSYGGSSLLINMACIGILMNIGASHTR
ncbi:MAG: putative lipid II flippase FtsW [Desulfobacterales bacterium]